MSLILSRNCDASDFDLMAEVRSEVCCRLRNNNFFRPFLQIRELERSGIISLRQTPRHAVLCGRTLSLGANSETKEASHKRRPDNESFHLTPLESPHASFSNVFAMKSSRLASQARGSGGWVGPGSLPSDSAMIGLNPTDTRELLETNLDIVVRLLAGETVSAKTPTHELIDARLQRLG